MDLPKAFHSLPHDLNIAKLAAYGLDSTALKLIFSYLRNRKQCVRINKTYSDFILGVSQGSIVGPLLFILSINDLFSFIESIHNFTDYDTHLVWTNTISDLINKLELEYCYRIVQNE